MLVFGKNRRAKHSQCVTVGERILKQLLDNGTHDAVEKQKVARLVTLFNPETETDDYIDFDHFAELWLNILILMVAILVHHPELNFQ